jgi:hypothetical protein
MINLSSNDDPISDWINQPIPEKLWHYTSLQGFQGIVGSGSIWATDVRFLNDIEEFVHARKIADELLRQTPKFGSFQFPLHETLEWINTEIFKSDFLNPQSAQIFVASFTASEDDLSQWRGYSHGTIGVSVALDLRPFRPPTESDSAITFAPCVYEDDEKKRLIQHALQHFVKVNQSRWNEAAQRFLREHASSSQRPSANQIAEVTNAVFSGREYTDQLLEGLIEAKKRIFRLSGLLKHRAFHHEKEWRLVLPISPGKDKSNLAQPIRFRSTGASLIPYIEFPLEVIRNVPSAEAQPMPILPVVDVMLGPGATDNNIASAQDLLRSKSVDVVPRISGVPYRNL